MTRSGARLWLLLAWALAGCGTVGPPVAPEDLGVAAKLEKAKKEEAEAAMAEKKRQVQPEEQAEPEEEELPPLRLDR
jgi:predicted small lipoprotein YifL